jgi:hypothetical protein
MQIYKGNPGWSNVSIQVPSHLEAAWWEGQMSRGFPEGAEVRHGPQ